MEIDPVLHLSYHRWATEQLLEAARGLEPEALHRDLGTPNRSIFGTLAHVFQADQIWLGRVLGQSGVVPVRVEPEQGIDALQREWSPRLAAWTDWARGVAPEAWTRPVSYLHSSGKEFSTPGNEIVLHLVNDGTLHRGQVMAMFRQVGAKPPGTDLIFYYRSLESR